MGTMDFFGDEAFTQPGGSGGPIEASAQGAGVAGERARQRDLNDIAGSWRKDTAFDSALAAQDTVDEEMWR